MRVLIVSSPHAFATRDVYRGHMNGLRALLGAENVISYDIIPRYNLFHMWTEWLEEKLGWVPRELASNIMACEPVFGAAHLHEVDAVYFISPMYFPMSMVQMLSKDGFQTWAYFTECPYEDEMWARNQAGHFDFCFVNDPHSLTRFRVWNERTFYIPHAYDPRYHFPPRTATDGKNRVVWVGTAFGGRREFMEAVDWGDVDLRLYGNWDDTPDESPLQPYIRNRLIHNEFVARIYRGGTIGLSFHREQRWWAQPEIVDPGEVYAVGPRTYELAACGLFQVSDARPELDEIFEGSVPTFSTPDELGGLVRRYLADPVRRQELLARQMDAVRPHTVESRMGALLELVS
jgi:spore maturation protein CgeB